jgi:LysR family transcriptional activator of mexEF-oprN operon
MKDAYARDLDLNLLRALLVVADEGSVTAAASRLYLTQPAVSAAIRRLTDAVGAPLFARQGRGVTLTSRGRHLVDAVRPHVSALVAAALSPAAFDPATSELTVRLGLSDDAEAWLLPDLVRALGESAPRMRLVVVPVQFRSVGEALASRRVDAAVTVADDLPPAILRQALFSGGFVCLFDPRHVRVKKAFTERAYFASEHVIVSYNGDLRGVVEDALHKTRDVRCSVSSFRHLGAILEGTALIATIPAAVADELRAERPHLRTAAPPFRLGGTPVELLWPRAIDDDPAGRFVRAEIVRLATSRSKRPKRATRSR